MLPADGCFCTGFPLRNASTSNVNILSKQYHCHFLSILWTAMSWGPDLLYEYVAVNIKFLFTLIKDNGNGFLGLVDTFHI